MEDNEQHAIVYQSDLDALQSECNTLQQLLITDRAELAATQRELMTYQDMFDKLLEKLLDKRGY
jgi:hypothetical protein